MMRKNLIGQFIKREFLHILPAFLFFFIAFNMINLSERLMLKGVNYQPFSFLEILLAVAFISKILLIIDHIRWVNLFSQRPLIYHVFWKTILYWIVTLSVRLLIRLASFLFQKRPFLQSIQEFGEKMNWDVFWGVGFFYLMLFFSFVAARELTIAMGLEKMRKLFLGR